MATDRQLVGWLRGRHPDSALGELLERYGPMVRRTALRVTGDGHAAEDVGQAVFLVLVRKSGSLGRVRSLGGLLHRLATDASRDWLKAEARRRRREEEAAKMKAAREDERPAPLPAGFDAALNRLPAACREAVVARYLRGLSGAEAAAELGVKEGTLEARLSRALARLRRALSRSSPELTVAVLGASLSAEAAGAGTLTTMQVASITAAAFGGAKTTVSVMAEGMVKAMMWTKIKIAAAIVCAATAVGGGGAITITRMAAGEPRKSGKKAEKKTGRKGPLAALPSKPGAHVARIKAMKDGEWLKLGQPAPDPAWGLSQGRAWTTKMALAPDLRGAFLYGEGGHAGTTMRNGKKYFNDDLWFYNLNAHAWVCIHPGTDVANFECRLDKNGFEVDVKTGQHIPIAGLAHGYEFLTYDTDQRKLIMFSLGGMWWPMVLGERRRKWLDWESKDGYVKYAALYKHPFYYDVKTGRWERKLAKGSPAKRNGYSAVVYIPSLRQFAYYGRETNISFFNYKTGQWTVKKPTGPAPRRASDGLVCLDEKRDRLYIFNLGMKKSIPWIYDIKTNTWIDPKPKTLPGGGAPPNGWYLECNESTAHYDSVNDAIVVNIGRMVGRKGRMFVYDVKANEWTKDPVCGPRKGGHSFYDPELNAHFFYDARDSSTKPGDIWAYRYKRKKAGKK